MSVVTGVTSGKSWQYKSNSLNLVFFLLKPKLVDCEGVPNNLFSVCGMTELSLKYLRPDVAPKAHFRFRVFAPKTIQNLPSTSGPWSKWTCTIIDQEGETATVTKKFWGNGHSDKMAAFQKKVQHGSTWVVNSKEGKHGFKAAKANSKYTSCSAPVELEWTDAADIAQTDVGKDKLPLRPDVRMCLREILSKGSEQRVDVIGIVQNVGDVLSKDCQWKGGTVTRSLLKIKVIDESKVDAEIAIWGDLIKTLQTTSVGTLVAFYRLKLSCQGESRSLSTVEESEAWLLMT